MNPRNPTAHQQIHIIPLHLDRNLQIFLIHLPVHSRCLNRHNGPFPSLHSTDPLFSLAEYFTLPFSSLTSQPLAPRVTFLLNTTVLPPFLSPQTLISSFPKNELNSTLTVHIMQLFFSSISLNIPSSPRLLEGRISAIPTLRAYPDSGRESSYNAVV